MSPENIRYILKSTDTCYSFQETNDFRISFVNTVHNGTKSILYLRPKTWKIFPGELKQNSSLSSPQKIYSKMDTL